LGKNTVIATKADKYVVVNCTDKCGDGAIGHHPEVNYFDHNIDKQALVIMIAGYTDLHELSEPNLTNLV